MQACQRSEDPRRLYCGVDGLYLGPAALIELRDRSYSLRSDYEIAAIGKAAYNPIPDMARLLRSLEKIASHLQSGELSKA